MHSIRKGGTGHWHCWWGSTYHLGDPRFVSWSDLLWSQVIETVSSSQGSVSLLHYITDALLVQLLVPYWCRFWCRYWCPTGAYTDALLVHILMPYWCRYWCPTGADTDALLVQILMPHWCSYWCPTGAVQSWASIVCELCVICRRKLECLDHVYYRLPLVLTGNHTQDVRGDRCFILIFATLSAPLPNKVVIWWLF
jgi:hypothetical protein